jgi:predicted transcriptional regulator
MMSVEGVIQGHRKDAMVRAALGSPVDALTPSGYPGIVSIELSSGVEEQLRTLAERQGRDVRVLVEEAIRLYLEAAAITDLEANDVAEAQTAMLDELPHIPDWKAGNA